MPVKDDRGYTIEPDVKFGFLELIDVPSLVAARKEKWSNQTLCRVNDCVVRLGPRSAFPEKAAAVASKGRSSSLHFIEPSRRIKMKSCPFLA